MSKTQCVCIVTNVCVVVGWCNPRTGPMPCPHAVAVLPPLPNALRNGKST